MSNTITYADSLADLDEAVDRAKDNLHAELEGGCSDLETYHRLLAKGHRQIEEARTQAIARLDLFWAKVDAMPDETVH